MKRKILTGLAALSLLVCLISTQGCYDEILRRLRLRRWIPFATATAGAIHTTVDTVGVTDGIMIDGVMGWMGS